MTHTLKRALIIRSASFQQLDKNLPELVKTLPGYEFHMLTHEHGLQLAEKYHQIHKVYVYPYRKSFDAAYTVQALEGISFDAVIVPVSNLTGAGFFNVLRFSLTIQTEQRYICNMLSELLPISRKSIRTMTFQHRLFKCIASFCSLLFVLPLRILLPRKLQKLKAVK